MKLSYKYRLYPNAVQRSALDGILETLRILYNASLQERRDYYGRFGKSRSYAAQAADIAGIKKIFPEFENIYSQTTQQTLMQVDTSFKNFFRRVKSGAKAPGFPRYKQYGSFQSFLFPQPKSDLSAGGICLQGKKLGVYGIPGQIPVKLHRKLPEGARCKQVRICREGQHYYVIFSFDGVALQPLPKTGKAAGFDLGISSFLTENDGTKFHHPRPLKRQQDRLIKAQRNLASKKRGSNNRMRAKRSLARIHQKVSNVRKDFSHKLATKLLRENDIVILEDLTVSSMLQNGASKGLHRSIGDVSWNMFSEIISYKAVKADKRAIFVNPRNTTKTCSRCGHIKDMPLSERTYHCLHCRLDLDRDLNAAINIYRLGMSLVEAERLKPAAPPTAEASPFRAR